MNKCPDCGQAMEELASAYDEFEYTSDDETIRKTTTEIYEQCLGCGYLKTLDLVVEEEMLPYTVEME